MWFVESMNESTWFLGAGRRTNNLVGSLKSLTTPTLHFKATKRYFMNKGNKIERGGGKGEPEGREEARL